jgi:cell pole-organizing protein PopZ
MSDENGISNRAGPGTAGEPSMDEILASIRRILKEDETAHPSEDPEDEILVLSAAMEAKPADISSATALPADPGTIAAAEAAPVTQVHFTPEPDSAVEPDQDRYTQDAPEHVAEMEQPMDDNVQSPAGLVGEAATADIASKLGSLVRSMSVERSVSVSRAGVSLEDIVREEIRPVLKSWLELHLPSLVERIVRAEIERVVDRTKP